MYSFIINFATNWFGTEHKHFQVPSQFKLAELGKSEMAFLYSIFQPNYHNPKFLTRLHFDIC